MVSSSPDDPVLTLTESVETLRDLWERTSFELEMRQCDPECVRQEREGLSTARSPPYKISFDTEAIPPSNSLGRQVCTLLAISHADAKFNGENERVNYASIYKRITKFFRNYQMKEV